MARSPWPGRRRDGITVGLLLAAAIGVWWWTRTTPPVTEAEARSYLDRIVAAARSHDFDRLCRLNGSVNQCRRLLAEFDLRSSVPGDPPTVVGSRYSPSSNGEVAGRILVVEGSTPCGKRYRTEVLVFRENRFDFKAINAVYWSNSRIIEDGVTSPTGDPPPTC